MDMSKMLKDLQKMQSKMLKAQSDLKAQSFDAEAGGGMVKVAMNGQGVLTMIKIYAMPTCPYCDYIHEQIAGREDEFQYINIGEHIRYLSAFMRLRDTDPVFDRMKEIGDVGVPAFVFEDGRVSIDPADAGLIEYGAPDACSLEDHKSGRKGC